MDQSKCLNSTILSPLGLTKQLYSSPLAESVLLIMAVSSLSSSRPKRLTAYADVHTQRRAGRRRFGVDEGGADHGELLISYLHRNRAYWSLQAEEALAAEEVPVGCVFVKDGQAIARARNRTNEWRNVCLTGIALNQPSSQPSGDIACRAGSDRSSHHLSSSPIVRHHSIRDGRAVCHVRFSPAADWHRQSGLWMRQ